MSTLALTGQELSYFSMMRRMLLCISTFPIRSDFIISLVLTAILIILLERHNVANHAVLKLTATMSSVMMYCFNYLFFVLLPY